MKILPAFCRTRTASIAMLLLVATLAAAPATSSTVTLPGGTLVPIRFVDKVSSATANVGDTFAIQAAQDVSIDGWVAIKQGATGEGQVESVDRAGSHGHAGTLGVKYLWIYTADGHKVHLTDQQTTQEGQQKKGQSSTVTIISAVFLGIPGLFAHNFVHGKDVEIDGSHVLKSYVDSSVLVKATVRSSVADPGFAPAASPKPM